MKVMTTAAIVVAVTLALAGLVFAAPCIHHIPQVQGAPNVVMGSTTSCPQPQGDPPAEPPIPPVTCPQNYSSTWALACTAPKPNQCCGAGQAKMGEVVSYTCDPQTHQCKIGKQDIMVPGIVAKLCSLASPPLCTDTDAPAGGGE